MRRVLACGVLAVAGVMLLAAGKPAQRLDVYVGKYPFDTVAGKTFLTDPAVIAAVKHAVPSPDTRKQVLTPDATTTPIVGSDPYILMSAFAPVSAGDHNWAVLGFGKGGPVAVCYASLGQFDGVRWYVDGGIVLQAKGRCPSRMEEVPDEMRDWLVHPDAVS